MLYGLIKYIKNIKRKKEKIGRILKGKEHYFKPGKYNIFSSGKTILYQDTEENFSFITKNMAHLTKDSIDFKGTIKLKTKRIISLLLTINIDNDSLNFFGGSLIIITKNSDLKIFDFDNKIVLNILNNKNKYVKIKSSYNQFKKFFNMPDIEFVDRDNTYIEEYIDYIPYCLYTEKQKEKAIEYILTCYTEYFKSYNLDEIQIITLDNSLVKFKNKVFLPKLISKIEEIFSIGYQIEIIKVKCHGDVNFYNLLLSNNKYYLIDWEDSNFYNITYDIVNLIFIEYAYNNNDEYLVRYIKGEYDEYFEKMFLNLKINYKCNEKIYYLAIFVVEKTSILERTMTGDKYGVALCKFLSFLTKAEEYLIKYTNDF